MYVFIVLATRVHKNGTLCVVREWGLPQKLIQYTTLVNSTETSEIKCQKTRH